MVVSSWVPAGFVPAFLKKIGIIKIPLVHCWDDYYQIQMTNYPSLLVGFLEKFTVKNADVITTISRYNESKARDMKKEVYFIPNGVDPRIKKSKINLDYLKTAEKNLKVVYLGDQFSKFKKVDKLILDVKDLKCDLFLLGKINKELVPLANKNIHFMGPIKQEEIFNVLKQADILVNPADMDHNLKTIEYIRAGRPIIMMDGKSRYIFEHKKNAFLTNDLADGLKVLIGDEKLREELEENVKKIPTMTWKEVADAHLKIYSKIIGF